MTPSSLPPLFRAVRFVTEESFVSWVVRRATNSRWSHVDVLDLGGFLGARFEGGVRIRPWNYLVPAKCAYGIFVPTSDGTARSADAWLRLQIGKSYDWSAIAAMPFGADWAMKNRWFCSELVSEYAERCGCPLQRRTGSRVSPQDAYESFSIRILMGNELAALKIRYGIPAGV